MRTISRREFTGLIPAVLFQGEPKDSAATASSTAPSPRNTISRRYRADAVILVLGIPIYRRAGVGGGQASLEVTGEGAQMRRTLFFAGGSDAKRAHGLQRLGWIREVVSGAGATPAEVEYFGVLTSSPEESLEHARESIAKAPAGRSTFSAVKGRHTAGRSRSGVTHFEFAAEANWSDAGLIEAAQATFGEKVEWRESAWPNGRDHAPPTFLLQLASLLEQRAPRAAGRYVYNEQEYLLELEAGQPSRPPERLLPVRGKIKNLRTGRQTVFRVWLDNGPGTVVPVRIEYQPRSFLRLVFEVVPG